MLTVETAGAFTHAVFGIAVYLLGLMTAVQANLFPLIRVSLTSDLLSFLFVSALGLIVAAQTYRHSPHPSSFVIPILISISDFIATISLFVAMTLSCVK